MIDEIYQSKKNLGLTKSLNILVDNALGDYIARQDDDDLSIEIDLRLK